ncbi:Ada metal-binding domain-containing protein [Paenibacillus sp. 102]|uniref:Ada metal-binding domain-containing protein n=1 Tax=Paenibacillus sp. 102 TaxID=3120823 RepID=UPI0031BB7043
MGKQNKQTVINEKDEINLTDERWQAIVQNDASYNEEFYYAVKTTKIFCLPSCKSRTPNRENVRVFLTQHGAIQENFRPCKRCKPTQESLQDINAVKKIKQYIDEHCNKSLTVKTLAKMIQCSTSDLEHKFHKFYGITLTEYVKQLRFARAMLFLANSDKSIMEIGFEIGIPNTEHHTGMSEKKK